MKRAKKLLFYPGLRKYYAFRNKIIRAKIRSAGECGRGSMARSHSISYDMSRSRIMTASQKGGKFQEDVAALALALCTK